MNRQEKNIKLIESFLETQVLEGVCDYVVTSDNDNGIEVLVVFDSDWVNKQFTKPNFIRRRISYGIKEEIYKFLGIDVYVGSTEKKCEKDINETISPYIRRRLSFEHMKQDIDNLADYELNPCEFNNIGDFVAEACDILAHNYLEELQVSSKDKDGFYIALVDMFGKHLSKVYRSRCVKGLTESKKTYIINESQLRLLCESDLSLFQKILKTALSGIQSDCIHVDKDMFANDLSAASCDEAEWISNITINDFVWSTTKYSGRYEKGSKLLVLNVDIHLETINRFEPFTLMSDLAKRISDLLGTETHIEIENIYTKGDNW